MSSSDYMRALSSQLTQAPPFEETEPTQLLFESSPIESWLSIALVFAIIGFVIILIQKRLMMRKWRHIKALREFLHNGSNLEAAQIEFRTLEILIGVFDESTRSINADWQLLNPSETEVALATLQDKTAEEIAFDLSCTKSHVYNIRAAIRRKWQLESSESFKAAIRERYTAYKQ